MRSLIPLTGLVSILLFLNAADANKFEKVKEIYSNPLAHGFGEDIDWVPWEDAIREGARQQQAHLPVDSQDMVPCL
ncbi:hypothetical protein ANCDUO_17799 [Ancylostoma duodenale]|uniref:Uncharacterized protein n=1 Tax=Ancylostoma duodenale TaxID=51022 RepID=A0A0C2G4W7_9BILA|nr:hypothetical protein ANCDUO_17799 [Ancylostoma duodenale]